MIYNMEMERKFLVAVNNIKESFHKVKEMVREF